MKRLLITITLLSLLAMVVQTQTFAANIGTSVLVGNVPPVVVSGPAEDITSSVANPTAAGSTVTFRVTANEPNDVGYYLAICKTNSVTANVGSSPTCTGGSWCVSGFTTGGTTAFCSYATNSNDLETNSWFAFVCDGNTTAACSSLLIGSGDSASPFIVNHPPQFTGVENTGPASPGQPITWTTATGTLDTDTARGSEQVKLIVCKSPGLANGNCIGGSTNQWCESSFVDETPSCGTILPLPFAANDYNAYAYVIDELNTQSNSIYQGVNSSFAVANISPTVLNVNANASNDIVLTEGTTTNVTISGTLADVNGCETTPAVEAYLYRSGIGFENCNSANDTNDNFCYRSVTCGTFGVNSCSTQASVNFICTFKVQYFAESTDEYSRYPEQNWLAAVKPVGSSSVTQGAVSSRGVELKTLLGFEFPKFIPYTNNSFKTSEQFLDTQTVFRSTGNVGLDIEMRSESFTDDDGSSVKLEQRYAFAPNTPLEQSQVLTGDFIVDVFGMKKPTASDFVVEQPIWWGLNSQNGLVDLTNSSVENTIVIKISDKSLW